jgi:hypothetical protein
LDTAQRTGLPPYTPSDHIAYNTHERYRPTPDVHVFGKRKAAEEVKPIEQNSEEGFDEELDPRLIGDKKSRRR